MKQEGKELDQFTSVQVLVTGKLVHWYTGTMVHWYTGTMVHWYSGSLVHWFTGTLVHLCTGTWCIYKMPHIGKATLIKSQTVKTT